MLLTRDSVRGADSGNRTRIVSLEGWGLAVGRCPRGGIGETRTRIPRVQAGDSPFELRSRSRAGCEGIEPSLRVLEARPVTMTLRPKNSATRRGIEPLSLHRQWSCDASRITGQRGDGRESNPPPQGHGLPSSPDEYRHSGSPWSRTTFSRASTERYHSTSSRPVPVVATDNISAPGGSRTRHSPLERRASLPLDDRGQRALVRNRTGASRLRGGRSTIELQGHAQGGRAQLQRKESNLRKTG